MHYLKYLYKHGVLAIIVFIMTTLSKLLMIITPLFIGTFIDIIGTGKNVNSVSYGVFILALTSMFGILLNYTLKILSVKYISLVSNDIYIDALIHLAQVKSKAQAIYNNNWINQRLIEDCGIITKFIIDNIYNSISNFILLIIVLIMCLTINIKMGVIILISFPVYITVYFYTKKELYMKNYALKESSNRFFSKTQEFLVGLKTQKIHLLYTEFNLMVNSAFEKHLNFISSQARTSSKFVNINSTIIALTTLLMIYISLNDILKGAMTIGEFTIINSYFGMLFNYLNFFINISESYQVTKVSLTRLNQIFGLEKDRSGNIKCDEITSIKLNQLSFVHENRVVISDFTYTFSKGKLYCMSGKNGAGKSTLVDIILGIYNDETETMVQFNDILASKIDFNYLRRTTISVCEQSAFFYTESINEYMMSGIDNYDVEKYALLCKEFNIDEIIKERKNKLIDVKELSGGEFKKISIVKSLIKDSSVLIMDEPTVFLDKGSIRSLIRHLNEIKSNRIIIVVSHDSKILEIADEIITLDA